MKSEPRPYRMRERGRQVAATGERILDAAAEVFWESPTSDIPLAAVAHRAGVSVQTVLRRFGDKDGLLAAAAQREAGKVRDQRWQAVGAGVPEAVGVLLEHYEAYGDRVLRLLAEAERTPALAAVAERGREVHRAWCEAVFAGPLERADGAARARLRAQLVAVTDVYLWKLLRRDAGLEPEQARVALLELLEPLVAAAPEEV